MKRKGLPIALMVLLLFALHLLCVDRISLHIDEFVTMWPPR
jgi:hypothetical protein